MLLLTLELNILNVRGQSHIDSSHTLRHIDAKTHPPTALSVIFKFSAKIDKILLYFNQSISSINSF